MTQMDDLDDLFAAASRQQGVLSPQVMARIVQDADRIQPAMRVVQRAPVAAIGWFATLVDWFGGGISLAGIAAAALTGIYLGVAQPTPVLALADLVTGQTAIGNLDVLPKTSTLWPQE